MPSQYLDVRFGSFADHLGDISLMSAFGCEAEVKNAGKSDNKFPQSAIKGHLNRVQQCLHILPYAIAGYTWNYDFLNIVGG